MGVTLVPRTTVVPSTDLFDVLGPVKRDWIRRPVSLTITLQSTLFRVETDLRSPRVVFYSNLLLLHKILSLHRKETWCVCLCLSLDRNSFLCLPFRRKCYRNLDVPSRRRVPESVEPPLPFRGRCRSFPREVSSEEVRIHLRCYRPYPSGDHPLEDLIPVSRGNKESV